MDPSPQTPPENTPPEEVVTAPIVEVAPEVPAAEPVVAEAAPAEAPFVAATPAPATENPGNGLGIASLILSIVGVHLIGIILGIIGLRQSKKAGHKNGLALAGIIIGIIGFVAVALFVSLVAYGGIALVAQCAELGTGSHTVNGAVISCS